MSAENTEKKPGIDIGAKIKEALKIPPEIRGAAQTVLGGAEIAMLVAALNSSNPEEQLARLGLVGVQAVALLALLAGRIQSRKPSK